MPNPFERGVIRAPADGEFGSTGSTKKETSQERIEAELRLEAAKLIKELVNMSIGEGESGIVVNFDNPKFQKFCIKYQKLQYNPVEFENLKTAYNAEKQVPRPVFEIPEKHMFVMEKIMGAKTIYQLKNEGCKFSQEVVDDIMDVAKDFCQHFTHNDLFDRNVMLENVVVENGVVVEGTPIIIDLERMEKGKSDEYQRVRGWFNNRIVKS